MGRWESGFQLNWSLPGGMTGWERGRGGFVVQMDWEMVKVTEECAKWPAHRNKYPLKWKLCSFRYSTCRMRNILNTVAYLPANLNSQP